MHKLALASDDYYEHLGRPHNPPPDSVSDAEFETEFYTVSDAVSAILSEFGENDPFGDGDYNFDPGWTRSRGIGFEISHIDFLSDELVARLRDLLLLHHPEWELYIACPSRGLFISHETIRYWFPSPSETPEILK